MLYNGEQIGDGSPPEVDIAVDPLEGTRLTALGMPSALAVIALRRARHDVRPRARASTWRRSPAARRSPTCSTSTGRWPRRSGAWPSARARDIRDVMVVVLDRPRHEDGIAEIREAGARVRLITDGDVSAALLAVTDNSPVDLLWGIGGTPEGVISAAAHQVHRRASCSGGCGRATTRSARPRSTPATTSTSVAHQRRPRRRRGRLLLRDRRHRRRRPPGRPLPGRAGRDDRVAGHALALGDGPPHPRRATTARSCARSPARATGRACRSGARPPPARGAIGHLVDGAADARPPSKRPTRDGARSRRASERRKPWVTITWIRDWVFG